MGSALVWWLIPTIAFSPACDRTVERREPAIEHSKSRGFFAPAADTTDNCADVHDLRVCWGQERSEPNCAGTICANPAPIPVVPPADALGWRCSGEGIERYCVERSRGVGSFDCRGARCVQRFPRFPDDGEWTCVEMAGVTVCYGGLAAAGVPETGEDTTWFCGARALTKDHERVCVDLAPDYPAGEASGWDCGYEWEPEPKRICERKSDVHLVGDACDEAHPCVDGSFCVARRCVPPAPSPSCVLDADCATSVCRFGTCWSGG